MPIATVYPLGLLAASVSGKRTLGRNWEVGAVHPRQVKLFPSTRPLAVRALQNVTGKPQTVSETVGAPKSLHRFRGDDFKCKFARHSASRSTEVEIEIRVGKCTTCAWGWKDRR